jgi:hypothetical protein
MSEIRRINRIHDTPGFVAGFLIGGFVAAFAFLMLLSGSLGME